MTDALANKYSESQNPTLQARVQVASAATAQAVGSEATDTPNHTMRAALATRVANSPEMLKSAFTTMLCAEGITSASTDQEISDMISAVWNTMAGQPA